MREIGEWGVFQVTSMGAKFYDVKSFNQDLSKWNVGTDMHVNDDDMFSTVVPHLSTRACPNET